MKWLEILFILLFTIPYSNLTRRCSRYPANTFTPKSPVDENFGITITGNAQTYILGQSYNVSLHAYNGHHFISAKLVLENENGSKSFGDNLGRLEVVEPVETRYSQQCINMIESTNSNPKTKLDAVWIAPSEPGKGCVLIRATVLQHRDVWFMDDGGLTRRVCEEVVDDVESQKKDVEETPCCICDEARYEIVFQGLWSRNMHPKDFPSSGWLTRFSDIVGAAHTSDYRFWDKGVLASTEMQEFAEHGSLQGLEREFNNYFKEGKIRTVIKARGPAFPNINTPSVASVRVDPLHHQVSIASKITPSPDWIVGVPGFELCLSNCTWLEERVINLYPWDIGTDAGASYTGIVNSGKCAGHFWKLFAHQKFDLKCHCFSGSVGSGSALLKPYTPQSSDQPQFPADVIRRMSSEYPPDPRSPFFDESHAPMKPLATLTIKRQRLYERKCEDEESNNPDTIPRECFTHPWSAWSECTVECGEGRQYRTRVYKQPDVAKLYDCDVMVKRRQERECRGENCNQQLSETEMEETDEIFEPVMPQLSPRAGKSKAACKVGQWSSWSQCNVTCGAGMMRRTREYLNPYIEEECQEAHYLKLQDFKECQGKNCLGGIANDPYYNENYNEVNYDSPSPPKRYEPFHSSFVHPLNKPDVSNQDEVRRSDHDYIDENTAEEVESHENDFTNIYRRKHFPTMPQESLKIIRPARRKGDPVIDSTPPEYCYQPLNIILGCSDPRVVGNFWFYNFCADECMLYAADICDNNSNKFHSLEACEENCATPLRYFKGFLKQRQEEGCRRTRPLKRNFKKRRNH